MKRFFSRICGAALAASLVLTGLAPAASAADTAITVTLNDQALVFSDARPIMRDHRTFVPFRAIFESMGASVSWDPAARTVTAKRGDRTVQLTIGRKAVTVDRSGADRSFSTDAAPFLEGGRTYVPVRFAAQALGAAVGWDNAAQTVLLVDTEQLINTEYAGQFQTLASMLAFAGANAPVSPRAITGTLTGRMDFHTAMGSIPVVMNGSLSGAESLDAAQVAGVIACDRTAIESAIRNNEGQNVIGAEVDALLKTLQNLSFEAIVSRVDGKLYLKSDALTEFGIAPGKWAMKPLALTDALTAVKNSDVIDFLCAQAQQLTLTRGSSAGQVRQVLTGYSDQSGDQTGLGLTLPLSDTETLHLTLTPGAELRAVRETRAPSATVPHITLTAVLRADGTSIAYVAEESACTTDLRLDLVSAGAGSAPAVRPA